ncbi:MAG: pilus assembly protein [Caldilineales bacterium]|nr:pilus assembly protein [Caldilineales bacterium]
MYSRLIDEERGSNLVEFSLVCMLLTVLLIGMVDFSNIVYADSVLQAGAQAGARYSLSHPGDSSGIQSAVLDRLVGLDHSHVTVAAESPAAVYPTTRSVRVTVSYEYEFIVPFIADLFTDDSLTLQGEARLSM